MKPTLHLSSLIAGSILCLTTIQLQAGTVRLYGSDTVPDPRVVASILSRGRWQPPPRGATRGLSPASTSEGAPIDAGQDVAEERLDNAAREAVAAWNERLGKAGGTAQRAAKPELAGERPAPLRRAAHAPRTAVATKTADKSEGYGAKTVNDPRAAKSMAKVSNAAPAAQAPRADALAVMVAFANNSAQLAPNATQALDAVAEGMKLVGFAHLVLIEGHANATGKAAHNMRLSQLRAETVKRYLVTRHAIPADALIARGYGTQKPLLPQDPAAAQNRRVQFRPLDA